MSAKLFWALRISAFAAALVLLGSTSFAQDCLPNDVREIAAGGKLTITDIAITRDFTNCPDPSNRLSDTFPGARRQLIYIWVRLQSDDAFLNDMDPAATFTATIHRKGDLAENDSTLWIDPNHNRIGRSLASNETRLFGGSFDWRFRAQVRSYLVPGNYSLQLFFGRERLCNVEHKCSIDFRVKRAGS